ncbi:MAG: hypothetical protein AB7I18_09050 [Candidatus Berkiella sp.]
MNWLKTLSGMIVSKFVLRAQLLPIGELTGLRWLWAKLTFSKKEIESLNNLWPAFIAQNNENQKKHPDRYVNVKRELLDAGNGVKLDTVELCKPENKESQEYVIYGWGRNDCYEYFLPRLATDALNLNKKIITFNFRNVGHSQGTLTHQQELVKDYKFQIERLIKKGVDPKNITCYAHSLCAAAATFGVRELELEGRYVRLYSDRSFANLMNTSLNLFFRPNRRIRSQITTVGTLILGTLLLTALLLFGAISATTALFCAAIGVASLWVPPLFYLIDKPVGWIMENTMKALMIKGDWVMDVAKTFDEIKSENKMHTVLRTANKKDSKHLGERKMQAPGRDKVILHPDSLHKNLHTHAKRKAELKTLLKNATEKDPTHEAELVKLSNSKMTGGEHSAWPHELFTRYKTHRSGRWITGQEHFYAFVEPNGPHDRDKTPLYRKFQ